MPLLISKSNYLALRVITIADRSMNILVLIHPCSWLNVDPWMFGELVIDAFGCIRSVC